MLSTSTRTKTFIVRERGNPARRLTGRLGTGGFRFSITLPSKREPVYEFHDLAEAKRAAAVRFETWEVCEVSYVLRWQQGDGKLSATYRSMSSDNTPARYASAALARASITDPYVLAFHGGPDDLCGYVVRRLLKVIK